MPPYYPYATNRTTERAGEDWRHTPGYVKDTVAEMKKMLRNWNHHGWKIEIRDLETGDTVAVADADGGWTDVEESGGEGPRDDETFPEYLARLRERQEA